MKNHRTPSPASIYFGRGTLDYQQPGLTFRSYRILAKTLSLKKHFKAFHNKDKFRLQPNHITFYGDEVNETLDYLIKGRGADSVLGKHNTFFNTTLIP